MAKAENKTVVTEVTPDKFLNTIGDEAKRSDSFKLMEIMQKATKEKPVMWGTAIIGFGSYHYKYDTGREGDMCIVGFSPRKANLTLYVSASSPDNKELLKKLGKHKVSGSCLHITKLTDIDEKVLKDLISLAYKNRKAKHAH